MKSIFVFFFGCMIFVIMTNRFTIVAAITCFENIPFANVFTIWIGINGHKVMIGIPKVLDFSYDDLSIIIINDFPFFQ